MFFLGQSASYLPYLLLAITYFAGLAGYSMGIFNRQNEIPKEDLNDKIVLLNKAADLSISESTYVISNKSSYFNSSELINSTLAHTPTRGVPVSYLKNPFPTSNIFSDVPYFRPPPVC